VLCVLFTNEIIASVSRWDLIRQILISLSVASAPYANLQPQDTGSDWHHFGCSLRSWLASLPPTLCDDRVGSARAIRKTFAPDSISFDIKMLRRAKDMCGSGVYRAAQ
jgi:hypothetical protein